MNRIDYERARNVPYRTKEFKLARMRELLAKLDNPHHELPVIHVAGTKGKGSTAVMVSAVLTAAGRRTGAFTSPHLERIEERIAVNGRACSAAELVELVDRVRRPVQEMDAQAAAGPPDEIGPTYFELTSAMAMLHFARRRVDAAVLEVGLGGRLDSTNVCRPLLSVITSISLDHVRQLGDTLTSIAREKAGIIKPSVPVISGVVQSEPREVIRQVCREHGCSLTELGIDFNFDYRPPRNVESAAAQGQIDFRYDADGVRIQYDDVSLGLLGRHQAANAAVALAALAELTKAGWRIPEEAIRKGLAEAVCPARAEVVSRRPVVVIDGAHNLASVKALAETLEESLSCRRRLLVFAASQEKDVRGMLSALLDRFDEVIFTRYEENPRSVPPEELNAAAVELTGRPCRVCPTPADAWREVRSLAGDDDLICITGSLFIAAEMRRLETEP